MGTAVDLHQEQLSGHIKIGMKSDRHLQIQHQDKNAIHLNERHAPPEKLRSINQAIAGVLLMASLLEMLNLQNQI